MLPSIKDRERDFFKKLNSTEDKSCCGRWDFRYKNKAMEQKYEKAFYRKHHDFIKFFSLSLVLFVIFAFVLTIQFL